MRQKNGRKSLIYPAYTGLRVIPEGFESLSHRQTMLK